MTYPTTSEVLRTDTFDSWATKTNQNRASLLYTQNLIGADDGLNTTAQNVVGAVNEVKTKTDNVETLVGNLTDIDASYRGTSISNTIESLHVKLSGDLSGQIDSSVNALNQTLTQSLNNVNSTLTSATSVVQVQANATDSLISSLLTSLGFDADGNIDTDGTIANNNNVKLDVLALDAEVSAIRTALGYVGSAIASSATEIDGKISASNVLSDNSLITRSVSGNDVTLSHALQGTNPSSDTMTGTTVIRKVTTDSAGHITSITYRNLGNQSVHDQYISSANPNNSVGNNGDVWYRI